MTRTGLPLRLESLSRRYGSFTALTPTDLDVVAGEFLTLLGPSGSGKTTLLNLIAGYVEPTTGRIEIGTRDVTHLPARQRNIGMVFQNYALFPHMTVGENIGYGLAVRGVSKDECRRRVSEVLSLMRLEEFADRPIQKMSGGQQQRVALARALVIEPDVLLMDEPLSALDKQLRRTVQLELRRLHQTLGRTTIYVTHDQEEALVLSDRIAVMDQGRIQQLGSVDDIYDRPANAFVAGFIGESNLLAAKVTAVTGGRATADVESFRRTIVASAGPGVEAGKPARLLVRPEHLLFDETGDGIPAEIVETVYLGELSQYGLALESGQIVTARQITDRSLRTGTKVTLSWKPDHALVVSEN
ncbi:ABC transporter ATP-binding protein [Mesorhizobium qingshengii]|uniref:Spermidine/putrescine import ATP-binding protein PotA n=1 Tax=Mesorhizobium qingshengii TaxID=1165689 RepID=A0A1G5ZC18_9HYPH|nr:ABC transporter ATP-binding protein [Mesorhizobium qingshengii]SDA92479.1 putative spermidine/putrescine transport system ATP-binding protein [Mesorhizobium qingshengii]